MPYKRGEGGKLSNVNFSLEEIHTEAPAKVKLKLCIHTHTRVFVCRLVSGCGWSFFVVVCFVDGWAFLLEEVHTEGLAKVRVIGVCIDRRYAAVCVHRGSLTTDHDPPPKLLYAKQLASLAKSVGVKRFIHVSALGADEQSPIRWLRTKAKARPWFWSYVIEWHTDVAIWGGRQD